MEKHPLVRCRTTQGLQVKSDTCGLRAELSMCEVGCDVCRSTVAVILQCDAICTNKLTQELICFIEVLYKQSNTVKRAGLTL